MIGTKSYSDAMHAYTNELLTLHRLIRAGEGDSEKADAIRERMDGPWDGMTTHEIAICRGLSADLYSIGKIREPQPWQQSADQKNQFEKAWSSNDLLKVLEVLRRDEIHLPRDNVATMRGWIWSQLGFPNVCLEFLSETASFGKMDTAAEVMLLENAEKAGRHDLVVAHVSVMNESTNSLVWLYLSGFYSRLAALDASNSSKWLLESLMAGMLGLKKYDEHQENYDSTLIKPILSSVNVNIAVAHIANVKHDLALQYLDEALEINPDNLRAIIVKNAIIADVSANKSVSQLFINRLSQHAGSIDFQEFSNITHLNTPPQILAA